MKKIIALAVLVSFNAFSASDSCPLNQNLIGLNENFELSIKSKKDLSSGIDLSYGKSKVYDSPLMTIGSHSQKLKIPKGAELKIIFASNNFYQDGKDQDRSVAGAFLLGNSLERIDFTINDRSGDMPTVKDLGTVLGDTFEISCQRKEIINQQYNPKNIGTSFNMASPQ
jgi:hypothetical protein